ncbi:MAG TPA: hypothetical protein VLF67_00205 [Candidatus Saccharimonas sp.]|nr:hypothetical protein [Candidatus Saccharimonas sp.]
MSIPADTPVEFTPSNRVDVLALLEPLTKPGAVVSLQTTLRIAGVVPDPEDSFVVCIAGFLPNGDRVIVRFRHGDLITAGQDGSVTGEEDAGRTTIQLLAS